MMAATGRLAVAAGNADDRDAAVVAVREEVFDDGLCRPGAKLCRRRFDVRQQAGAGIDVDDGAAPVVGRAAEMSLHDVDPAMSRPTMRASAAIRRRFRMDVIRDVEFVVGGCADQTTSGRGEERAHPGVRVRWRNAADRPDVRESGWSLLVAAARSLIDLQSIGRRRFPSR